MRILVLSLLCAASVSAQVTVLNSASSRPEQPVAPGSWATAYGGFAGVTPTQSQVPHPKTLGGVTVTVGGVEAPLYFVSATQVNFLIPAGLEPGLRPIEVKTPSATVSGNVRIMTAAPGLFVKETTQQWPPKGAALNQDGRENTSDNPARRGEIVQIYGTGPGSMANAVVDGAGAPRDPLNTTRSTPQVYIGGVAAQVQFSGLTPDLAGLWQINAYIPNRPFLAGRVPVQVFVDGVDSNEVAIFVAQ
jgi:uncharacterized protein (TIGR03437 family)